MVRLRLRVVTVGNLPTSMATKLKQGNKTNYQGNKKSVTGEGKGEVASVAPIIIVLPR